MAKMNPEVKAKIVAALRSGKYKQGKIYLREDDCYCVWGIISDVSTLATWENRGYDYYGYLGGHALPAEAVQDWAGIHWLNDEVVINGESRSLAAHNDRGVSFEDIANAIEEQL